MKQTIYIPTVRLPREIQNSVEEHEVLLSFNNDSDTEFFEDWWEEEGLESYAKYLQDKRTNI